MMRMMTSIFCSYFFNQEIHSAKDDPIVFAADPSPDTLTKTRNDTSGNFTKYLHLLQINEVETEQK
jgi:hypothetical protein